MRTIAFAALTLFLLTSAAYAQDPPPPQFNYYSYGVAGDDTVYAWAVIDDGGMYGEIHTPSQQATLSNPSGTRSEMLSGGYRVDLSLSILDGEWGSFRISSYHSLYCTWFGWIMWRVQTAFTIPVPPTYLISMRAFIPENLLLVPLWCWNQEQQAWIQMYFSGDNRWFDARQDASYRAQSRASVRPNDGVLRWALHDSGVSKGYGLEPGIDDDNLDDCYRLHVRGYGDASPMRASGSPVGAITNRTVRTRFYGATRTPAAPLPDIDWDFKVDIQSHTPPFSFGRQWSWHDCYPAYEIYIHRSASSPFTSVHGYVPPRRDWLYLFGCLQSYNPEYPQVQIGPYGDVIR